VRYKYKYTKVPTYDNKGIYDLYLWLEKVYELKDTDADPLELIQMSKFRYEYVVIFVHQSTPSETQEYLMGIEKYYNLLDIWVNKTEPDMYIIPYPMVCILVKTKEVLKHLDPLIKTKKRVFRRTTLWQNLKTMMNF